MINVMAGLLLTCILALPAFAADQITAQGIGPFRGLNTNQAPEAIDATQSPDLLNVDIANGNTSVKKRQGYGLDVALNISTSPVHNLYKFFDSSGNEVRLAFNDFKVSSSINGAAWSVILTTGVTLGATWDCTDYLGSAYCVSSAFDCPIKTNGTTAGTTGICGTNQVPQGSLVSNSGDRLLIGATSANPSRLYYSQSAVFTNFTLGVQPSDSSFEDITAPGSKLTHLAYRFGRWLWWKDQSFGFIVGTGQFDLQIVTVSNTIGTYDNTDVFDGKYVYFRGSDAQIYTYDGFNLSRAISSDIGPSLLLESRRKSNLWTQTSQSDFQGGVSTPAVNISLTISPGDVTVSSFVANEYSNTQWNSGSSNNFVLGASSISLNVANANIPNNGFESGSTNWTLGNGTVQTVPTSGVNCTLSARSGSNFLQNTIANSGAGDTYKASLQTCSAGTEINNVTWSEADNSCAYTLRTLSSANAAKKSVKIVFTDATSGTTAATSDCFLNSGTDITFYTASDVTRISVPVLRSMVFDDITNGSDTVTSGYYTSPAYNTGFTSSTFQLQGNWTISTSSPTFSLLTSTGSTGPFVSILTSTGTNAIGNKFAIYTTTISVVQGQDALTAISSFTILSRSTGTYYSAVNNALSLTSWSTFGATDLTPGNSAITYYVRAATGAFTVGSSTVAWVQQTKNATVNYSTGTYFQMRADFALTAATETPTMSDFTFNWFEGAAADKMYATYFKNAIWFALSNGTTSTNNRIFRYDLLSSVWTLYDIASNGFVTYNNDLYFGDPSAGKIYRFGNNVYSDNGTAISAYWKSKPFFGDSPFTEKDLRMGSWYVAYDSGTTLTTTYTLDESTNTVVKTINLYSSTKGLIRNNFNFPAGTAPTVFSTKVGDNSSNPPWEVFGGLVTFVPRPIIVTP